MGDPRNRSAAACKCRRGFVSKASELGLLELLLHRNTAQQRLTDGQFVNGSSSDNE